MKNALFLFISLLALISNLNGQDFSKLKDIPLKDSIQCKNAEQKVLECSNYLLSTFEGEDLNSLNAAVFIIDWMSNTPDFTFSLEDKLYNSLKDNFELSSRFLASECKIALLNNFKEYNLEFKYQFMQLFLNYCQDANNKVKVPSKVKKLIDAKNKGNLKDYLEKM